MLACFPATVSPGMSSMLANLNKLYMDLALKETLLSHFTGCMTSFYPCNCYTMLHMNHYPVIVTSGHSVCCAAKVTKAHFN